MSHSAYSRPISDAISALVTQRPFEAVLLFDLLEIVERPDTPTAETDGRRIYVGDWFANLPMKQRLFVLSHEIWHVVLNHFQRAAAYQSTGFGPDLKPFSPSRWNRAADYIINAALLKDGIGDMPEGGLYNPSIATADSLTDPVYSALEDDDDNNNFDQHLDPAPDLPSPAQTKVAVTAAAAAAKAAGKLGAGLARLVGELLAPQVPWAEELRDYITAVVRGRDSTSWRRLNRRKLAVAPHVPYPGREGFALGDVVVAIDTSGSISRETLTKFTAEVGGILEECHPERLHIVWWDTQAVLTEVESMDDLERVEPFGGGGTVYDSALNLIEDEGLEPDLVLCFTDGWVECSRTSVPWPHITLTIAAPLPFGKNIVLT